MVEFNLIQKIVIGMCIMIKLLLGFFNGTQLVRNIPIISEDQIGSTRLDNSGNRISPPAWISFKKKFCCEHMVIPKVLPHHDQNHLSYILDKALSGYINLLFSKNDWEVLYTFADWIPITAWEALPFEVVPSRTPLIRSAVQKPGLLNVFGDSDSEKIKSINLKEAIRYSYLKDLRFILCLCAMLGFSIWWIVAPEPLLIKPAALCSPDLSTLFKVVRDSLIKFVVPILRLPVHVTVVNL